ncbi:MAG: leucine-rich repeat domain-containing protein [Lachnospiraceae bacterium]|nr:leucine-rich repeat domain-containing protein [Lachnospiraceae bacterium]
MRGMKKYRMTLALLSATALTFTSLNPANIVFGAETDTAMTISEEASSDLLDLESSDYHWSLNGDVLRYTSSGSAVTDLASIKDKVKKVVIESGATTIEDAGTLSGFSNLEEVEYEGPVNIKDMCFIESNMYNSCPKLKKVTIGPAKEGAGLEINKKAFMDCTSLTDISFGKGVWHFGYMTFGNCTGLEKLVFPADMHNVRGDSFIGCSNLKELELADTNSYMRVADNAVYEILDPYTDSSKRGGAYKTPCLMFVPEGVVKSAGGNYTITKGTKDVQYWAMIGDPSLKNLTVASTIESIQHEAFYDCKNLQTITLPKSLERVGQYAFGIMSENAMVETQAEDLFEVMHKKDVHLVNPSITDVYYQGSEDDWKKIKSVWFDLNEGHLDKMKITKETTLWNNLEEVGLPKDVKIHYNCELKDTENSLDELMTSTTTMSFNSKDSPELKELGINLSIKYTSKVYYNGRKHLLTTDKKKASNDIDLKVEITDANTGKATDAFKVKKVKFKNNKVAADSTSAKAPYFTIQLAATSSLDKTKKAALKKVNKLLKDKKVTDTNFYFTIAPADLSSMVKVQYVKLTINGSSAKFKKLAARYKYTSGGEPKSDWIVLKPCKGNSDSGKGDFTYVVKDGKTVEVTGHNNFTGTVTPTQYSK